MAVSGKERVASAVPNFKEARFRKEAGLLIGFLPSRNLDIVPHHPVELNLTEKNSARSRPGFYEPDPTDPCPDRLRALESSGLKSYDAPG